uniref:Uncharacterized protein n=1 Tax=Anguilla anguilla TaxID=7936 RepID=A0A0E9TRQ7_ANGAN
MEIYIRTFIFTNTTLLLSN